MSNGGTSTAPDDMVGPKGLPGTSNSGLKSGGLPRGRCWRCLGACPGGLGSAKRGPSTFKEPAGNLRLRGLGGPESPRNHSQTYGRRCPSYLSMVSRAPGAAQRDPPNTMLSSRPENLALIKKRRQIDRPRRYGSPTGPSPGKKATLQTKTCVSLSAAVRERGRFPNSELLPRNGLT